MLLALAPLRAQFGPQLYGEGFGKNKIQYRDFNWKIYHSPHFNVYYYKAEEPQLQKVVSIAESAYDQLSRAFNFQIKDPIPLIYYATHSAFEQNNVLLELHPRGGRRLRQPGPLPHGAADRPRGRRAQPAHPARADPRLPVRHALPAAA